MSAYRNIIALGVSRELKIEAPNLLNWS